MNPDRIQALKFKDLSKFYHFDLWKVIEKLIHRLLLTYPGESKLISKFQFGFRQKLLTELTIILLLDDLRKCY